jgi:hypothetical protein
MLITWQVEDRDVDAVREVLESNGENPFVVGRIGDNVAGAAPTFSRDELWRVMLGCLLTTQKRSGPDSRVTQFLRRRPFRPALADCIAVSAEVVVAQAISEFGGLRRGPTIARQAAANLEWLEADGWLRVEERFRALLPSRSRQPRPGDVAEERQAAIFVDNALNGFGPKQSRNLWQWLGLTRFEIPLDRRVTDWLNQNQIFPFTLSATALGDENYYAFVMDGLRMVCDAADVMPCVFDAAVFSLGQTWRADQLEY